MFKFLKLIWEAIFEAPRAPSGLSLSLLGSPWSLSERPWALPHAESTAMGDESVTASNSLWRAPGGASEGPRRSPEASRGAPWGSEASFWASLESPRLQNWALVYARSTFSLKSFILQPVFAHSEARRLPAALQQAPKISHEDTLAAHGGPRTLRSRWLLWRRPPQRGPRTIQRTFQVVTQAQKWSYGVWYMV